MKVSTINNFVIRDVRILLTSSTVQYAVRKRYVSTNIALFAGPELRTGTSNSKQGHFVTKFYKIFLYPIIFVVE